MKTELEMNRNTREVIKDMLHYRNSVSKTDAEKNLTRQDALKLARDLIGLAGHMIHTEALGDGFPQEREESTEREMKHIDALKTMLDRQIW